MKRICFFSGDISKTGGTEKVTLLIANELVERGYDISILSYQNGIEPTFVYDKRIKFYSLHLERYRGFFSRKVMPFIELIKFNKNNHQDIMINVDVLLANYTLPIKNILKSKIISWEHFNFRNNNGTKSRDYARKLSAKYADYIVVLTKADLNEYKASLNIRNKIINIYNPIDKFNNTVFHSKNIVLASGRLVVQKNFEELIEIWKSIYDDTKEWKLFICGEGENREKLQLLIEKYNLNNVELKGFCKDMNRYYSEAKIFVMTSKIEGFPMVLLEAQNNGLPIVSYDCFTGPSEIVVDGQNGYLIGLNDKKSFENKLLYLMQNQDILEKMSDNSYKDRERFNVDKIINQWEDIINELK